MKRTPAARASTICCTITVAPIPVSGRPRSTRYCSARTDQADARHATTRASTSARGTSSQPSIWPAKESRTESSPTTDERTATRAPGGNTAGQAGSELLPVGLRQPALVQRPAHLGRGRLQPPGQPPRTVRGGPDPGQLLLQPLPDPVEQPPQDPGGDADPGRHRQPGPLERSQTLPLPAEQLRAVAASPGSAAPNTSTPAPVVAMLRPLPA